MTIEEEDWLGGCVPFTGIEADIPTGIIGLPAGIFIEDLIKSVIIFDDNTENGLKEVKKTELKGTEKIANIKFWEARIDAMITGSGPWIIDASGHKMTRKEWYDSISPQTGEPRHTDGLAIDAMKKLNWIATGGGVQVYPSKGKTFGVHAIKPQGAGTQTTDLGSGRQPNQLGDPRNR